MDQPWICTCSCGYSNCIFWEHPTYKDCKECFKEIKKEFKKYLEELKNEQK